MYSQHAPSVGGSINFSTVPPDLFQFILPDKVVTLLSNFHCSGTTKNTKLASHMKLSNTNPTTSAVLLFMIFQGQGLKKTRCPVGPTTWFLYISLRENSTRCESAQRTLTTNPKKKHHLNTIAFTHLKQTTPKRWICDYISDCLFRVLPLEIDGTRITRLHDQWSRAGNLVNQSW